MHRGIQGMLTLTPAPQQTVTTRRRVGAERRPGERVAQYCRAARSIINAPEYWVARSRGPGDDGFAL